MNAYEALEFVDSLVFAKTDKHLSDLQRTLLSLSWADSRTSYEDIAASQGYSSTYLKQDVGPKLWQLLSEVFGEKVKKSNFKAAIERQVQLQEQNFNNYKSDFNTTKRAKNLCDWGEAPEVSVFFGRDLELRQLENWILEDRSRLIAILGMGGIGKTHIARKCADNIKEEFDYVIWRSLTHGPSLSQILTNLLQIFNNVPGKDLPTNLEEQISALINHLRKFRCLLIFDNVETILRDRSFAGDSFWGYEDYGKFFKIIGECQHDSCLLITSREKPKEIVLMEGETLPVRSFKLKGLTVEAAKQLLLLKGCTWASGDECQHLVEQYSGNPLALKIISPAIEELFQGNIAEFINQKTLVFEQINELLGEQINRISQQSQSFLYWMAINQDLVEIKEIENDFCPAINRKVLWDTISAISHRCLLEQTDNKYYLQPVVKEYLLNRIIDGIVEEIVTGNLKIINSHALLKATAKEYIREAQISFLIKPILEKLLDIYKKPSKLEERLEAIIKIVKKEFEQMPGYAAGNIINILSQFKSELKGYDFSNLSVWQAYLPLVKLYNVNFTNADLSKSILAEQISNILSIAFNPNDQILATGDTNGEIRLWHTTKGKLLRICKGHASWVHSVCFSRDGLIIASGSSDHTVKLWNLAGECIKTYTGHTLQVRTVAFHPSSTILASGSSDGTVRLWDIDRDECIKILAQHKNYIWSIQFSPDGKLLASASEDKTVKIWDVESGECLKTLLGHDRWVRTIAFSEDGLLLASGGGDKTIKLWDVESGECLQTLLGHTERVRSLSISNENKMLVSGGGDHTIRLWDLETGTTLKILHGHSGRLNAVAFSHDGKLLATGGEDRLLKLWDVASGESLKTWQGFGSWIQSVAFSPDGSLLACGSEDQTVRLWDLKNLPFGNQSLLDHKGWVCSVSFSPDGKYLASASSDYSIKLWDVYNQKCLKTLLGHTRWIRCVSFSLDGEYLASGGGDSNVKLWDIKTGKCIKTFSGHNGWLWSVAFRPNSKMIASASEDKTIKLWNLETGECINTFEGHSSWVQSVVFSPDGKYLASAGCDCTIRLWDVNRQECLKIFKGHLSWVQCLAFSPDGEYLASGSCDEMVKLWDLKKGNCAGSFKGHSSWVWSVAFSPDGKILASGSQDETTKLWNITTGECVNSLSTQRPLEGTCLEGVKGLTSAELSSLEALGAITKVEKQKLSSSLTEFFLLQN